MIKVFDMVDDKVIKSKVLQAKTTYHFGVNELFPLINRFHGQRKIQDPQFYDRLKRDIIKKCIIPPITIAFVIDSQGLSSFSDAEKFINENISSGYVLDGIQRLNTLKNAMEENPKDFPVDQALYMNIIISENKDNLLYRMITLNNGQKPMTPRHQIEVLTQELFNFNDLSIDVQTERERSEKIVRGAFNLADISKSYLAFITKHIHNDNNKIISEKMDELIVNRILDANVAEEELEFNSILMLIDRLSENEECKKWLKQTNNLIGFTVGLYSSFSFIEKLSNENFEQLIAQFERAFAAINISKVNLGKMRRELSLYYIKNIEKFKNFSDISLTSAFSDQTAQ